MFNRKLKKKILDQNIEIAYLNEQVSMWKDYYEGVKKDYMLLSIDKKTLEKVVAAQGELLVQFATYIANHKKPKKVKKIKIKKGAKHAKKSK